MQHDPSSDTIALTWEADPILPTETLDEAAVRLGCERAWLREMARKRGLIGPAPVGRPRRGTDISLRPWEWNRAAAPRVIRYVDVASLEVACEMDWRRILSICQTRGEFVHLHVGKVKYSLGASAADRVVAYCKARRAILAATVSMRLAATIAGVNKATLARIVATHRVPVFEEYHGGRILRRVVMDDVRTAMALSEHRETVAHAAKRTGTPLGTLRGWLARAGVLTPDPKRRKATLDPDAVDRVVAGARTAPVEREGTAEASERTGVPMGTLRRWLALAGHRMARSDRRKAWLRVADVDAVVNKHRPPPVSTP